MSSILDRAIQEINAKYAEALSEIIIDGKIKRAGDKDHIWYVGHEWEYKGNLYQSINYGSWRFGDNNTVKSWDAKTESQKGFRDSLRKHTEDAKIRLDAEIAHKQQECKLKWTPIFGKARPNELHPYLRFKGIDNAYISRVDYNGVLLIPVYDINGLVGVQRIYENPESKNYDKKFSPGIKIKASFCPLTPFKNAEYVFVSEGFATAASIQMAYPHVPSICVFNASNIPSAIGQIRTINPKCKIIIAADKDHNKIGERYAKKAVDTYPSVIYRVPSFPVENAKWTDFNDLHQYNSLDSVREQLKVTESDFLTVTCLGHMESDYFYTSNSNNQIVRISTAGHNSKCSFFDLAPMDYWVKHFGMEDENGNMSVSWVKVSSDLMAECRKKGLFDPDKIRGRGVWKDGKTYTINDGEKLTPEPPVKGYHYQKLIKTSYELVEPFNDDECESFLAAFQSLRYKDPREFIMVAAWVVQAQVFACLPWRFHVWLTGSRGCGKSTILKWINSLLPVSLLTNNATAPGIRQELKNDAFPTIFDETEPDSGRMKGVIELARQMSSNGDFKTLRGTSAGKVVSLNTNTVFLLGSIQKEELAAADQSRIFLVEMMPTKGQDLDEYEAIVERFEYFSKHKNKFFSRCYHAIPTILRSAELTKKYLQNKQMEARLADQLSMMIACFWVYASTEVITEAEIELIVNEYGLVESDYVEHNKENDAEECLNELMRLEVDRDSRTVAHCLRTMKERTGDWSIYERYLGAHGIRYYPQNDELFIAAKSSKLKEKMKKFPDYANILKREPEICRRPKDKQRIPDFGEMPVWGVRIKLPQGGYSDETTY